MTLESIAIIVTALTTLGALLLWIERRLENVIEICRVDQLQLEVLKERVFLLEEKARDLAAGPPTPVTTIPDSPKPRTQISEEGMKVATARIREELMARGVSVPEDRLRDHVLELLGG